MLVGAVTILLLLGAAAADTNSVSTVQSTNGHRMWQIGSGPSWMGRKLAGTNSVDTAQSVNGHREWQIGSGPNWTGRKLAGANSVDTAQSVDGHREWQIGSGPNWTGRKLTDSKVPEGCADATGKFGGDPNCGQFWPGKKLLVAAESRPVTAAIAAATAQSGLVAKMGQRRILSATPAAAAAAANTTSVVAKASKAAATPPKDHPARVKHSSNVTAATAAGSSSATPDAPKTVDLSVSQRLRAMFSRRRRASPPSTPVKVAATSQSNMVNNKSDKQVTVTPKKQESAMRSGWGYYSPWGVYRTAYSTAGWGGPSACAAADVAMSCSYGRKLRMMLRL